MSRTTDSVKRATPHALMLWGMALLVGLMLSVFSALQVEAAQGKSYDYNQADATPAANTITHALSLTHHEFEPWDFVPKPGERIAITNHSNIAHSVYITYPDETVVNLGVQLPGEVLYWKVPDNAAGEYLLQCWIHSIIRATLTIQGATSAASTVSASKEMPAQQMPAKQRAQ